MVASTSVEGQYNHPLDAAIWLQHFKTQNGDLLKTLQVRVCGEGGGRGVEVEGEVWSEGEESVWLGEEEVWSGRVCGEGRRRGVEGVW